MSKALLVKPWTVNDDDGWPTEIIDPVTQNADKTNTPNVKSLAEAERIAMAAGADEVRVDPRALTQGFPSEGE